MSESAQQRSENSAAELDQVLGAAQDTVHISRGSSPTVREGVVITPLRLKQFSQVLKCINELSDAGVSLEGNFDAAKLLLTGGDVAIKLLAIASGLPVDVVEKLELDEAAVLAAACWRVNKSFFEKKAETILGALGINPETAASLKSSLAGLKSSALSSATGTG